MPDRPALSVAVVCGSQRGRAQVAFDAVAAQSAAGELELVVVDLRPELGPLRLPAGLEGRVLPGTGLSFGAARERAARAARAPVVAFVEDHCYPGSGWAAALLAAYREPWASVGYAFENANSRTLVARIAFLAHYGQWADPVRGPVTHLPGNNVSYRRAALLELADRIGAMPEADFNVHAQLRRRGLALGVEPAARVAHEHEERIVQLLCGSHYYSRILAAERARIEGWTPVRRALRAAWVIGAAPAARLAGLLGAARDRRIVVRAVVLLPGIVLVYLAGALGESAGYLLGEGGARARFVYYESEAARARPA